MSLSPLKIQTHGTFRVEKIVAEFDQSGIKRALYAAAKGKQDSLPPYNEARVALEWDSDEGVISCKLIIYHSEDKDFRDISWGYQL